tara:strand:+ start:882 stop:1145 length:264 start_codon:yes stop_codon:yes gene_type:complete
MNMRECKRLKPGALITQSYAHELSNSLGMVLHKEYVEEEHYAKVLGGKKHARYDLYIHWLEEPKYGKSRPSPDKLQCWEVKLLKNGK